MCRIDEENEEFRREAHFIWKLAAGLFLAAIALYSILVLTGCGDNFTTNVTNIIGAPTPTPVPSPTPPACFPTGAPCGANSECCALNCTDGKCK